jgi:2',3'-cyclic-nucleotide 2'-phosphodiesterase (5'-nucleotidase family)
MESGVSMKKLGLISFFILIWMSLMAEHFTLFYTNDTHGAYRPRAYRTFTGVDSVGGYETLYRLLYSKFHACNQANEPYLWVDAGDQQTGSVFAGYTYQGAIGGAVIESFNLMGLDAATFGNHEFDQSFANTQKLVENASYPFISSNLVWKKNGKPFTGKPYTIIKKGGIRIGILGLTMTDLDEKVKAANVKELKVIPYKKAINKYLKALDKQTDVIILLSHIGLQADSLLAASLDNRIDIIVGGHSHDALEQPKVVNGILILQTGAYLGYAGWLPLEVKNDRVSIRNPETSSLLPISKQALDSWGGVISLQTGKKTGITAETLSAIEKMEAGLVKLPPFIADISAKISKDMDTVIGTIPVDWIPNKYTETEVSRWQADALLKEYKEQYKADIAMLNCGGIRKAIPKGEITLRDLNEMLPFNNYIVIFEAKGSDLLKFAEYNQRNAVNKPYDIVQSTMPGWVRDSNSGQEGWFDIGGQKLVEDKLYRVVSHDYLAGQWDKYLDFKPLNVIETGDLILDVMVKQVINQYGI